MIFDKRLHNIGFIKGKYKQVYKSEAESEIGLSLHAGLRRDLWVPYGKLSTNCAEAASGSAFDR